MQILVIGNGGREHALCWKLAQSPQVTHIFCAPGNPGTATTAKTKNVDLKVDDIAGLLNFAQTHAIDLTVVGPEIPLVLGIADQFQAAGLKLFGPSQAAAQVEGSKAFAKRIMEQYGIPTAKAAKFNNWAQARAYVQEQGVPIVIKADGLAAGKGVAVCHTLAEAEAFIDQVMQAKSFGAAGDCVVIEEFMIGQEASVLALTDGETILPLAAAQDHKQVFDGDQGPNTGGMGAYCPTPVVTPQIEAQVLEKILKPMVRGLCAEGIVYKGILYAGLMIHEGQARVVEFNARLGDPETQCVLPRLENDLVDLMLAVVHTTLRDHHLQWKPGYCLNVVLASGGYPGPFEKGFPIEGVAVGAYRNAPLSNIPIFHAGTAEKDGKIVTAGGRVLNVVGIGATLPEAIKNTYQNMAGVSFQGMHFRKDIGQRVLLNA